MARQPKSKQTSTRTARVAGARASRGTEKTEADAPRKVERQAVVIVHGMGEQRPLQTLRGFVEAVWGGRTVPSDQPSHHDMWLVPDTRAGQKELARVTTRQVQGVGTDFYELYWADKLTGNTLAQLNAWVRGLLLRWPHQVPRETAPLWVVLWAITLAIVGILVWVGKDASWAGLLALATDAEPRPRLQNGGSIVLAALLYYLGYGWLKRSLHDWSDADRPFSGTWQANSAKAVSLPVVLSWAALLLLPAAIAAAAWYWFPWGVLADRKGIAVLAAILIVSALTVFVVPVFGDVARYVRTSPDAVSARADIRERGLELLRALHGPKPGIAIRGYDFGDTRPYDRIVVVAHSLGSIIAYDVLRLFWHERGPSGLNPPEPAAVAALEALDDYCRTSKEKNEAIDPATVRRFQADVQAALLQQEGAWRITDFVTLGSPLTHAEFLISPDRHAFEQRKAERLFPTCPPMLEPGRDSFMYDDPKRKRRLAHHAALFAATRWVNIFDAPFFGIAGDFISGPCRENFGPGIVDVPIRIGKPGLFPRFVTHTSYWDDMAGASVRDESWKVLTDLPLDDAKRAHLAVLRAAMGIKRRVAPPPS